MGIRAFFNKIKTVFTRVGESPIPYVDQAKRYGKYGEDEFTDILRSKISSCKIKRNVLINSTEGNAEIDCLVYYQNKLFAIEIKRWKGRITEQADVFLQEKLDRYTGEIHTKYLKSPFKQLGRSIYLLRKQIPVKVWINSVVFFEDNGLESISISSNGIWFNRYQDLVDYIINEGKESFGLGAEEFFEKCIPADHLYANTLGKFLNCVILRNSLQFETSEGVVFADNIDSIKITHHLTHDDIYIKLLDKSERVIALENKKIQVIEKGQINEYSLCKLDYIKIGREISL